MRWSRLVVMALLCGPSGPACSGEGDRLGAGGAGRGAAAGSGGTAGAAGKGAAGAEPSGPLSATVKRYDYAFDLATAHARSQVELQVAAPGGTCVGLDCAVSAVTSVSWAGAPAASDTLASSRLTVCGPGVAPGALSVASEAELTPQTFWGLDVGFSHKTDMAGGSFTYLLSWIRGCDRFGPCDADPSRLAELHFDVTHDAGTVVLCPGTLTPGTTSTTCDLAGTLAPTYSGFGLAADSLWKREPLVTAAGVDLVFYEVPGGSIASSLEVASVAAYIDWITGLLGPLPYGSELRFAGAPTVWLGFEHPGNILLQERLSTLKTSYANPPMHVLMHETAHQWAGDRTTLAATEDFVWKEASAEYLAYVFEDEHRPPAEAAASLLYWDTVSLYSTHHPRPTDAPPPAVQAFYGDVYGPGPMVLYVQLETMIGRPAVLAGIRSFLSLPGSRSVADLRMALEAASGKSLTAYFDAWVFGSGSPEWPTFSVSTAQTGDQVTVTVTQKNPSGKVYGCAIDVLVQGATQAATAHVDFGLAPQAAAASAAVTLSEPLTTTVLDPAHRVIGNEAKSGMAKPPAEVPAEARPTVWIL